MKQILFYCLTFCFIMLPSFSTGQILTAKKILQNCQEIYEKQMREVKDITEVTDKWTIYKKWSIVKGKTICKIRNETETAGMKSVSIYDGEYMWSKNPVTGKIMKENINYNPYEPTSNLKDLDAQYIGKENIDGYTCYVLSIKDMSKFIPKEQRKDIKNKVSGRMWIDAKEWIIRKMEMETEQTSDDDQKIPLKIIIESRDFRKVNGVLIPHKTITTIDRESIPKVSAKEKEEMCKKAAEMSKKAQSKEEQENAREQLDQMKKHLEEMPQVQRKMAEAIMKPQMEQLEKIASGCAEKEIEQIEKMCTESKIIFETDVKSVKINTGLSDDLFNGDKLK